MLFWIHLCKFGQERGELVATKFTNYPFYLHFKKEYSAYLGVNHANMLIDLIKL